MSSGVGNWLMPRTVLGLGRVILGMYLARLKPGVFCSCGWAIGNLLAGMLIGLLTILVESTPPKLIVWARPGAASSSTPSKAPRARQVRIVFLLPRLREAPRGAAGNRPGVAAVQIPILSPAHNGRGGRIATVLSLSRPVRVRS